MDNFNIDTGLNNAIMTPKQVAGYLQISPRTVYSRWEKLGGLKIGRTLRFRKEDIDALFRQEKKEMERGGEKETTKGLRVCFRRRQKRRPGKQKSGKSWKDRNQRRQKPSWTLLTVQMSIWIFVSSGSQKSTYCEKRKLCITVLKSGANPIVIK